MKFLKVNTETSNYVINMSKIVLISESDGQAIIEFNARVGNTLRITGIKQSLKEILDFMN